MANKHVLVVLDDSETYSLLDGSYIVVVNDDQMEEIEGGSKISDVIGFDAPNKLVIKQGDLFLVNKFTLR